MVRVEFDVMTGEKTEIPLTADEIAALAAAAAAAPRYVPQEVTRFQALAALHMAELLERVEAIIAAPETDVLTRLAWQNAQTFKRNSQMVSDIALAIDLTDQQIDDLFVSAVSIE